MCQFEYEEPEVEIGNGVAEGERCETYGAGLKECCWRGR